MKPQFSNDPILSDKIEKNHKKQLELTHVNPLSTIFRL
jgi:hypothetical protein